jgi:flavodoxin/ferredoxin
MKCVVIYFSQTGNTEKVAKAIQIGVKQVAGHCDIVKIKEANPRRLYEYDLIGLGSPVFHNREPGNITAFINNMRFVGGKHVFSFCTHCTLGDGYFPSVVPKLKRKGLIVVAMRDWYGHSWGPVIQPTPYLTDGHPDEIDLKEAKDFGREVVELSHRISAGETDLIPKVPPPVPLPRVDGKRSMLFKYKDFVKHDREKCLYPACRLCMDNCPMDGIDLSVEPPILARPCLDCMFCEAICPTGAIQADEYLEKAAQEVRRTLKEQATQSIAEAEAQGRFRRLVLAEDVGWDTPVFKVHNKHPRWIIGKGPQ